jgi:DNA (cytosine-5)-methyltransferase 1
MKYIDLFCGIGGFHKALDDLNCECVFACDIDYRCCHLYNRNFNIEPQKDITKVDEKSLPDFDILCAGFPCQPFSNGGKKQTFQDKRGLLFDEIIRIASYKKPKFMFLENVKHILKVSNGKVFDYIKEKLSSIDYNLQIFNLSPHKFNIPQQRERIFFICVRNDIYTNDIDLYFKNKNMSINDIIDINNNEDKYKISKEIEEVLDAWNEMIHIFEVGEKISPTILINDYYKNYDEETFKTLPKWKQDYMTKNKPLINKYKNQFDEWYAKHKDLLLKREIYGKLEWQTGIIKKNDSIYNYFIQFRQSGIRVKKSNYFPTLVAIVQTPIYGKLKRYITPRECARLQSFPDDFILDANDSFAYKQLGNSVNVFNVFTIINSTFKHYGLSYLNID